PGPEAAGPPQALAQPAGDPPRPGADRPGADQPGADRPGADRPGADQSGTDNGGGPDTAPNAVSDTAPNVGQDTAPNGGRGVGPAPAGSVLAPDGRRIPDEEIQTRTITDEHGRPTGRASFHDADWALREGPYRSLRALGTYEHRAVAGQQPGGQQPGGAVRPVPWDREHAYFYAGHADRAGFDLRLTDGTGVHGVGAGQLAGLLRRRPSVAALRAAAAGGKPASIVLLGCESAEHARAMAELLGVRVDPP
ncbi:hypothetical protein ACFV4M_27270, partial [Kitasatospora indigofera]